MGRLLTLYAAAFPAAPEKKSKTGAIAYHTELENHNNSKNSKTAIITIILRILYTQLKSMQ